MSGSNKFKTCLDSKMTFLEPKVFNQISNNSFKKGIVNIIISVKEVFIFSSSKASLANGCWECHLYMKSRPNDDAMI